VKLDLPEGWKINALAPMSYRVEAAGEQGPVTRNEVGKPAKVAEPAETFEIRVPVSSDAGEDALKVSLTYYYCQESAAGVCKVGSVAWSVPIKLAANAEQSAIPLEWSVK
jgi:hypothetical protein